MSKEERPITARDVIGGSITGKNRILGVTMAESRQWKDLSTTLTGQIHQKNAEGEGIQVCLTRSNGAGDQACRIKKYRQK